MTRATTQFQQNSRIRNNRVNNPQGSNTWSGIWPPSDNLGTNGDSFIDTSTFTIYGPKANNTWVGVPFSSLVASMGTSTLTWKYETSTDIGTPPAPGHFRMNNNSDLGAVTMISFHQNSFDMPDRDLSAVIAYVPACYFVLKNITSPSHTLVLNIPASTGSDSAGWPYFVGINAVSPTVTWTAEDVIQLIIIPR